MATMPWEIPTAESETLEEKAPWEIKMGAREAGAGRGFVNPPRVQPEGLGLKERFIEQLGSLRGRRNRVLANLVEDVTPPKELTELNPKGSKTPLEGMQTALGGSGLGGLVEGGLTAAGAAAMQPVAGWAGVLSAGSALLHGKGPDEAAQSGADTVKSWQNMVPQASTPMGKYASRVAGAIPNAAISGAREVGGAIGKVAGDENVGEAVGGAGAEAATSIMGPAAMLRARRIAANAPPKTLPQAQAAIKEAMDAGYKAMPNSVEGATGAKTLTALAKKPELRSTITLDNQKVSDRLIRRHAGLEEDAPVNADTIAAAETPHNKVYEELRNIKGYFTIDQKLRDAIRDIQKKDENIQKYSPEWKLNNEISQLQGQVTSMKYAPPEVLLDMMKKWRQSARQDLVRKNTLSAEQLDVAHARLKIASAVQNMMDEQLTAAAKRRPDISPDIIPRLAAAREALAKIADLEKYTNLQTGRVNASAVKNDFTKGKIMSGDLLTIAKAAKTMPDVIRSTEGLTPAAELSVSDAGRAAISAGARALSGHGGVKAAGVLGGLTGPIARKVAASEIYQQGLVKPNDTAPTKLKVPATLTLGAAANAPWREQDENTNR